MTGSPSMTSSDTSLITPELLKAYSDKHAAGIYGRTAHKIVSRTPLAPFDGPYTTVLDYGAGARKLEEYLKAHRPKLVVTPYDPAIPAIAARPEGKFDIVASIDVLEHIQPELLDNVLDDILSYAGKRIYLNIATRLAGSNLPDGRNLHLIVETPAWWVKRVERIGRIAKKHVNGIPKPNSVEFVIDL